MLSPGELAMRYPNTVVSKSIRLIEDARRALLQFGVRVAEDIVSRSERTVVEVAKLLVAVAWNKLGLRENDRNALLKVLRV